MCLRAFELSRALPRVDMNDTSAVPGELAGARAPGRTLLLIVKRLIQSPALQSAALMALGGVGFAIGNLLLASHLPSEQFGLVSLMLSVIQVGGALCVPGLPTIINRHHLAVNRTIILCWVVGAIVAGIASITFVTTLRPAPPALLAVLALTVAMAGMGRLLAAVLQSHHRLRSSLVLAQGHNWLLLLSVATAFLLPGFANAFAVIAVLLAGYIVSGTWGYWATHRLKSHSAIVPARLWWAEGASAAGVMIASNLLFQLDRLLIGSLLSIQELATYSAVAAIAGSAFRMLQTGAGHSLLPRLRACVARTDAIALLKKETAVLMGASVATAVMIAIAWPIVAKHVLHGKYQVSAILIAVIVASGFVRVLEATGSSTVSAIGNARELVLLNWLGWLTVAVSIVGGYVLQRFGLLGVVIALGLGWTVSAIGSWSLTFRSLRHFDARKVDATADVASEPS
jgi:O-antigen/teichoic acid export membrane protein